MNILACTVLRQDTEQLKCEAMCWNRFSPLRTESWCWQFSCGTISFRLC